MQTVLDADNGPGEIVVNLGYVTPPLLPPTESGPSQFPDAVSVTTVARFSMTRRRAQELAEILQKHIGDWDNGDRIVRGGDQ